ncbi:MAG: hypothetical protein DMD83_19775, partial [Candidatus Rokuibacteriota bacterium]
SPAIPRESRKSVRVGIAKRMSDPAEEFTITALAEGIRRRRLSPVEATRSCVDRIARLDPRLRAFITLDAEGALAHARTLETELMAGRLRGPLHGVPLAYKDLCHVPGLAMS